MRKFVVGILWVVWVQRSTSSCFVSSPRGTLQVQVVAPSSFRTTTTTTIPSGFFHRVPSLLDIPFLDDQKKNENQRSSSSSISAARQKSPLWRKNNQGNRNDDKYPLKQETVKNGKHQGRQHLLYHKILALTLAIFLAVSPYCGTAHAASGHSLAPEQVVLVPSVHHPHHQAAASSASESLLQRNFFFVNDDCDDHPPTTTAVSSQPSVVEEPQEPNLQQQQKKKSILFSTTSATSNNPALVRVRKLNQLQGWLFLVAVALATRMAVLPPQLQLQQQQQQQGSQGPTTETAKDSNNDTKTKQPSPMLTRSNDTFIIVMDQQNKTTTISSSTSSEDGRSTRIDDDDDDTVPPTGKLPPFLRGNPSVVTVESYRQTQQQPTTKTKEDDEDIMMNPTITSTSGQDTKVDTETLPPGTVDDIETPQRSRFLPLIPKRQPSSTAQVDQKDMIEIHSTSNRNNASAATNTSLSAIGNSNSTNPTTNNTSAPGVSLFRSVATDLHNTTPNVNEATTMQQQPPPTITALPTTRTKTITTTATLTTKMSVSQFKAKAVTAPPPVSSLEELFEGTMGPLGMVESVTERSPPTKKYSRVSSSTTSSVMKDRVSPTRQGPDDGNNKDPNNRNKNSLNNQDGWNINQVIRKNATSLAAVPLETKTQAKSPEKEVRGSTMGASNVIPTLSISSRQEMREEQARQQMMKLRFELVTNGGRSPTLVEPTTSADENDHTMTTLQEEIVEDIALKENGELTTLEEEEEVEPNKTMSLLSRQVMREEEARRQMMKLRHKLTNAGRNHTGAEPTGANKNDDMNMTTWEKDVVEPMTVNENDDLPTLGEEVEPQPKVHNLDQDHSEFAGNEKMGAIIDLELVARKLLETRLALEANERLKRAEDGAAVVDLGRGKGERSMFHVHHAIDTVQEESESGWAGDLEAATSAALSAIGARDHVSDVNVCMAEQIVTEAAKDMANIGISTHQNLQAVQGEEEDPSLSKIDDLERDMQVVTAEIMREDPSKLLYFADDAKAKVSAPQILFCATVRKNDMSTPLEAKDIALFAGVLPDSPAKASTGPIRWMPNYLPKPPMTIPPIWTRPPRIQVPLRAKRTPQPYLKLIPVNEAAVQLTSGILGAAVGFSIGGPALGFLSASAAHWASRDYERGGDLFDITQMVSEGTIGSINLAGAVLHTFEVDDMLLVASNATTQKIPLLKGTGPAVKVVGEALNIIGDLNFMFVRSAVEFSKSIHFPDVDGRSTMVNDWLQKVYDSATSLRQPRQHVVHQRQKKTASSAYFIDMEAVRQSPE
jgi:hypothetical protein